MVHLNTYLFGVFCSRDEVSVELKFAGRKLCEQREKMKYNIYGPAPRKLKVK
jgi:hypothetical protein